MSLFLPQNHIQRLKYASIFLIIFCTLGFGVWQFIYSNILKARADSLVQQNQLQTAILLYQQAKATFPFRIDIDIPLKNAEIFLRNQMMSEETTQSVVELPKQVPIPVPTRGPLFFRKHISTPTPIIPPEKLFVPILMYHHIRINPQSHNALWASLHVNSSQLNQQLSILLAQGYHTITLDQLYAALQGNIELPSKPIVLTFDDGYKSFYENAFPLLQYYHMHATEFIITNYMLQGYEAYLTPQQILEMDKSGLITFGAHTKDHPDLTKLAKKTVFNEIKGSKNDLEFLLKKPIHWFAYPYGAYNESVIQTVRSAGFEGALSTIIGSSQTINTIFLMPRIMVDGRWDVQTFIKNIQNK